MSNSVRDKQRSAFRARYERDFPQPSSTKAFGDWVNSLSLDEFFGMIDLGSPKPKKMRTKKPPISARRLNLCKALCGVAAFHVESKSAQMTVYKAVRELQR